MLIQFDFTDTFTDLAWEVTRGRFALFNFDCRTKLFVYLKEKQTNSLKGIWA